MVDNGKLWFHTFHKIYRSSRYLFFFRILTKMPWMVFHFAKKICSQRNGKENIWKRQKNVKWQETKLHILWRVHQPKNGKKRRRKTHFCCLTSNVNPLDIFHSKMNDVKYQNGKETNQNRKHYFLQRKRSVYKIPWHSYSS